MNLNTLSSEVMLSNSQEWLTNPHLRRALEAHPLGSAMLVEIQAIHDRLSGTVSERNLLDDTLQRLTAELDVTDLVHDRKARGLHGLINALIEVSDDPQEIAMLTKVREALFPHQLRVVRWSYSDEHGAVVEMQERISAEVRAYLAEARVGKTALLAFYEQWVAAGMRLGELTKKRARIQATVKRTGVVEPSIDIKAARREWIRVIRVFLEIVAMLPLGDKMRRALLAPLERDVAQSLQSRARRIAAGGEGDGIGSGEPDESAEATAEESADESAAESAEESAAESVDESAAESVTETLDEPLDEAAEPASDVAAGVAGNVA